MDPSLADFFLFVSKLITLHNPLLIIADEETFPLPLCNGRTAPIICSQFSSSVGDHLVETLMDQSIDIHYYPILISDGGHEPLVTRLSKYPILFNSRQMWVVPIRYAKSLPLRLDNNIFFYDGNASVGYNVYESYAIKGKNPVTKMLFKWHHEDESIPLLSQTLDRRSNLNGAILKESWPTKNRKKFGMQGSIFDDTLFTLQEGMNFSLQYMPPRQGKFGTKFQNGTWNGLVGMLIEDEIDLVGGLMVTPARDSVVDFAWPVAYVTVTLFSSTSSAPRLNAWVYLKIFPLAAWMTGFAIIIVLALCFAASNSESISNSVILMTRLLLQIGYELPTRGIASKALLLIAALSLTMIFTYYTSDLTAKMTASPKEPNINSFEDVERLGYQVVGQGPGYLTYSIIGSAPEESAMRRVLTKRYTVLKGYDEINEFAKKVGAGDMKETLVWALINSHATRAVKNIVPLYIIETRNIPQTLSFEEDSELLALFNHNILKMRESGIINRIKTSRNGNPDQFYGMSDAVVIGYENILFPFACLALGSLLAISISLVETIVRRYKI